jgi:hypothetical protein
MVMVQQMAQELVLWKAMETVEVLVQVLVQGMVLEMGLRLERNPRSR